MRDFTGRWAVFFSLLRGDDFEPYYPLGRKGTFRVEPAGPDVRVDFLSAKEDINGTFAGRVDPNDPAILDVAGVVDTHQYRLVAYLNALDGAPRLLGGYRILASPAGGPGEGEGSWMGTPEDEQPENWKDGE